jgi:hypothetical protein
MLIIKNTHPKKESLILDIQYQIPALRGEQVVSYIETDEVRFSYDRGSIRKFIDRGWIEVLGPTQDEIIDITRTSPFLGDENGVSTSNIVPIVAKQFLFVKNKATQVQNINGIRLSAELKSDTGSTAIFQLYIGTEMIPRGVLVGSSSDYKMVSISMIDLSDLDNGVYPMYFKLSSSVEGIMVGHRVLELYVVR